MTSMSHSFSAVIHLHDNLPQCHLSGIFIDGGIDVGDAAKFQKAVSEIKKKLAKKNCSSSDIHVRLNSIGGNVDESILIGNEIRKNMFATVVLEGANCYSSCVLIYASGVNRFPIGRLGIHRPYFTSIKAGQTPEEVRASRESVNKKIRNYLDYLDVPTSLLDEMLAYPPEKMKILSEQELIKFRLTGKDATQDEIETAEQARFFNLTSLEFRKRSEESNPKCSPLIGVNSDPNLYIRCYRASMLRVSEGEYDRRISIANKNCASISTLPERNKCARRYLIEGK